MSHGRISRASQRHPDARRRQARYGKTRYGQKSTSLPPHLLPGVTGRGKKTRFWDVPKLLMLSTAVVAVLAFIFVVVTVVTGVVGSFATVNAYKDVNKDLPNAAQVSAQTFQTTDIYDRNGTLLQEVDNPDYGWRTFVAYDNISQYLIDATVAAEDSTFWTNQGVEPVAIVRGGLINLSGAGSSGGSTITQQLVRAIYPDQISALDISYTRKVREAMAAYALAQKYSKQDIMTMYLNQIYYGARSYGIEAAAQTYFNKHAKDLTLAEASMLAGLPQAPSAYEPSDPDKFEVAKRRQRYVLDQMVKYRYITRDEADAAFADPLHPSNVRTGAIQNAPHFTEYVKQYIIDHYGKDALYSGLQITTSIDLPLQAEAEQIVANGVASMAQYDKNNGAMVVMSPWSGEILAMVGSADFNNAIIGGQVNYATSLIQPGSSMKPIVYASAFEKGWNPGTVLLDVPTTWKVTGQQDYKPSNYSGLSYGAVTVRTSLANSLNIPAVLATDWVGVQGVMDTARKMGLKDSLKEDAGYYGLSLGLGAGEVQLLEHTNAYATLANNGTYVPANPILEIKDSQGNVLYRHDEAQIRKEASQAIPAGNAYQVTSILTDNDARAMVFTKDNLFGNTQSQLGRPTAAKSGTTEDWKDLWTMGYTTDVAVGVWVGKSGDSGQGQIYEIDGIQAAGPIWQQMMVELHTNPEFSKLLVGPDGNAIAKDFPIPDTVAKQDICATTGQKAGSGKTSQEWVVKTQAPTRACGDLDTWQTQKLDNALQQMQSGSARWASGAQSSLSAYARAVGRTNVPDVSNDGGSDGSSSSGSGGGETSGGNTTTTTTDSGGATDTSGGTSSGDNGGTTVQPTSPPIEQAPTQPATEPTTAPVVTQEPIPTTAPLGDSPPPNDLG
ncbi:MAG: transglycosylase domain-containing protein [Thermomicrobiales bacterium]